MCLLAAAVEYGEAVVAWAEGKTAKMTAPLEEQQMLLPLAAREWEHVPGRRELAAPAARWKVAPQQHADDGVESPECKVSLRARSRH